MPPEMVYRCAICQTERRQVNHWFVLFQSAEFELMRWEDAAREGYLHDDRAQYLCGREHAITALSRFLDASATQPATPAHPQEKAPDPATQDAPTTDSLPVPSSGYRSIPSDTPAADALGDLPEPEAPREVPRPAADSGEQRDQTSFEPASSPEHGLTGIV